MTAEGNEVVDHSFAVAPQMFGFVLESWQHRSELSDGRSENPRRLHSRFPLLRRRQRWTYRCYSDASMKFTGLGDKTGIKPADPRKEVARAHAS